MPRHASIFDMVSRERFSCPLRTLETYCWLQLINSESCFPMALRIGAIAGSYLSIAYATSVSPPDEADAWQWVLPSGMSTYTMLHNGVPANHRAHESLL